MEELSEVSKRLGFTTGNSTFKSEILSCMEEVLTLGPLPVVTLENVIRLLRPFTLDWDRVVRSRAFRVLRVILPLSEGIQRGLGIDLLALIRLESSKSAQERASILRFLAKWLTVSRESQVIRKITRSLVEILSAYPGVLNCSTADFYSTIFAMLLSASKRFPTETLRLMGRLANSCLHRLDQHSTELLLDSLVLACDASARSLQLSPDVLTPRTITQLSKTLTGISILHHSFTAKKVCEEAVLLMEVLDGEPSSERSAFLQMLKHVPDVGPTLLHSAQKTISAYQSSIPVELDLLCAIKPPGIQNYLRKVEWRFPEWIAQKFLERLGDMEDAKTEPYWAPLRDYETPKTSLPVSLNLDPERVLILNEILQLLSSVQFKTRAAKLAAKRQQNPALFQSPQLWAAVYGYMYVGSFNLQSRRVIHGLLVHAICSPEDLALVDALDTS